MTDADRKALAVIDEFKGEPFTCVMLGERLFDSVKNPHRQAYARPAGKVLRRLKREGLVVEDYAWVGQLAQMMRDPDGKRSCWRRV